MRRLFLHVRPSLTFLFLFLGGGGSPLHHPMRRLPVGIDIGGSNGILRLHGTLVGTCVHSGGKLICGRDRWLARILHLQSKTGPLLWQCVTFGCNHSNLESQFN